LRTIIRVGCASQAVSPDFSTQLMR
jgi:hypothetical protein